MNAMDKAVARELMQYAARRQGQELTKWRGMPGNVPDRQYEAQRMRVAAWATAVQELFTIADKKEQPV